MAHVQRKCSSCRRSVPSGTRACPHCGCREASWVARYRGSDRREHSQSFERKTDAERFLAGEEAKKARGDWIDPALGRLPFGAWVDHWLKTTTHLRPSSRSRMEGILRLHLLPRFGDRALGYISTVDVRGLVSAVSDCRHVSASRSRLPAKRRCDSCPLRKSRPLSARCQIATAPSSSSAPTEASGLVSSRVFGWSVWTSSTPASPSRKRLSRSRDGFTQAPRRQVLPGWSRSPGSSRRRSQRTSPHSGRAPRVWSSRPPKVGRYAGIRSAHESGSLRFARRSLSLYGSTISGILQ